MDKKKLAEEIYNVAYLRGEFLLRSGQIAPDYFDKYQFEARPELLKAVAQELAKLIPKDCEVLAGLEMGGIPIATALSLETGIPTAFVRKEAKKYGTRRCAEGVSLENKKVLIIEDVITSGGQVLLSTEDIREEGGQIIGVLCVIERDPKGRNNIESKGLTLTSLFNRNDLIPPQNS